MTNSILKTLTSARALLDDPKHWTRESFARNSDGHSVPFVGNSVCWCIAGAIRQAALNTGANQSLAIASEQYTRRISGIKNIPVFNDHETTTHPMILAVLDKAIEARTMETSPRNVGHTGGTN